MSSTAVRRDSSAPTPHAPRHKRARTRRLQFLSRLLVSEYLLVPCCRPQRSTALRGPKNRDIALTAILDNHLRGRLAVRRNWLKFSKGLPSTVDESVTHEPVQDFVYGRSRFGLVIWRRDLCYWLSAIGHDQGFSLANGAQIASQAVFEFAAANLNHCSYLDMIVATSRARINYRLRRMPGRVRPARVSCQVK